MSQREEQYLTIHREAFDLFVKKNHDYGDAFATFGPLGVMVRMQDKLMRYIHLENKKTHSIHLQNTIRQKKEEEESQEMHLQKAQEHEQSHFIEESLEDTLMDLHNYAAMALMLLRESKSNV